MSKFTILRTDEKMPTGTALCAVRAFLFGVVDGWTDDDKKRWRKLWKRIVSLGPGEIIEIGITFVRSTPFQRRHMKIEMDVFNSQEVFSDFKNFRRWLKISVEWVEFVPGLRGGIVPLTKSTSYAEADQVEFEKYARLVISGFRGPYIAPYLWGHLPDPHQMMDSILSEFGE